VVLPLGPQILQGPELVELEECMLAMAQVTADHSSLVGVEQENLEMVSGGGEGGGEGAKVWEHGANGGGGGGGGGGVQQVDVDDDFARWQEEIRQAEEEAEAMKAGKGRRYHADFRKREGETKAQWTMPAVEAKEEEERPQNPPEGEEEFIDDDGTVYRWDHALKAWAPQVLLLLSSLLRLLLLYRLSHVLGFVHVSKERLSKTCTVSEVVPIEA
jgi:hypothetical protein